MTKDQIRQLKREKRQRRQWNKYKKKLEQERIEIANQFHNAYYWNSFAIDARNESKTGHYDKQETPQQSGLGTNQDRSSRAFVSLYSERSMTLSDIEKKVKKAQPKKHVMAIDDPLIMKKMRQKISLATVVDESCTFYEQMERRKKGSLETMLKGLKDKIETGKVKIEKREQYDPAR